MKPARGMTLLEIAVVLAVISIVSALVVVSARAPSRNGHVTGAAQEIRTRLGGLRTKAMSEANDLVLIVVDAPGSDASGCGMFTPGSCARYFVLSNPSAAWTLSGFDPDSPAGSGTATANLVSMDLLPVGVHLDLAATPPARPAPFTAVPLNDPDLVTQCNGRNCVAVRFTARGDVNAVRKDGGDPSSKIGVAFVLGSDINAETNGAIRQELMVSFTGGIVKTLAF